MRKRRYHAEDKSFKIAHHWAEIAYFPGRIDFTHIILI